MLRYILVEFVVPTIIAAALCATLLYLLSPQGMAAAWRTASCLGLAE